MKTRLGLILLAAVALTFGAARPSWADEPEKAADDEQLAKVKEILEQSIDWYDVLPDAKC